MNRRNFLLAAPGLLATGAGCRSQESTAEPSTPGTPSDEFYSVDGAGTWRQDLGGRVVATTAEVDAHVATESTLSWLSPEGTLKRAVDLQTTPSDLIGRDGSIYLVDRPRSGTQHVSARDTDSGAHRWSQPIDDFAPTLVGATEDAVFVGTTGHEMTIGHYPAFAFEADSGEQRWRAEPGTDAGSIVSHGLCLVWTVDTLLALDTATGNERWTRTPGRREAGPILVASDVCCLYTESGVTGYALPEGTEAWHHPTDPRGRFLAVPPDRSDHPMALTVGDFDGVLTVLDPATGDERWTVDRTGWGSERGGVFGVGFGPESVVARIGNTLASFDDDGTERWAYSLGQVDEAGTLVVIDETIFVLRAPTDGEVYVETFDLATGQRRWRHRIEEAGEVPNATGVLGDTFLVGTESGQLYGFAAGSGETTTKSA